MYSYTKSLHLSKYRFKVFSTPEEICFTQSHELKIDSSLIKILYSNISICIIFNQVHCERIYSIIINKRKTK